MEKIFSLATGVLITTLLFGCGTKEAKKVSGIKASSDTISSSTQNPNMQAQGQDIVPANVSDATSSATSSGITNNFDMMINDHGALKDYIAKPVNVLEDDWLTNFAGGRKDTITIRIGNVMHSDSVESIDPYLELEGKDGHITLIANGSHYEYEDSTYKIKGKTINFLTGKMLVGKEIVKDYSNGKHKIVLIVDYNKDGVPVPSVIFCSQNDSEAIPKSNYYKLEVKD